ncbi:unnamed protein product [Medioppia subpectinata]|uniref:Junctophilin n=2 Tax=Medioppia subpectinata TaxID=1979941 RepID=A0A7R9KUY0_9ACAR|nr:unnamed protein product [Medioppia subpectinata]CAG2109935.1 unnamed protein product [Medioppia subpectinata]
MSNLTQQMPQQSPQMQPLVANAGVINGGRFDFDDGGTYCGGWHDGKAHGHGICTGPKGQGEYSGSWHYGFEVSGVYKWPSGATFEGQWQNGKRHGIGVEYRGKWVYKGEWTQGFKGRYGVRASLLSTARYEGTWANGLQDGYGSETYADGGTYQGQWLRGMRHGYGVRSSAPYGHCNITKAIVTSATNASLQSLDTEGESQADNKRDTVRGGFVLVARNSFRDKRRNSLVEKSSNLRTNLFKGLRLRKQRSTGDIDLKSSKSNTPSLISSREASESGSAASFKEADQDVGSNASFLSQNGDISDPTTTETYMGEWKNDKRCGFGVCERSDGLRYEGEWYNNKKYGYGVTIFRDGTREEGKYKNNQLVTNVRKKHLFVIRSSKVRERIESAVVASHRAQQIALQKADIAISRTATARGKGEQADFGASSAQNDSQMAFITAKQYGGTDLSQSHSLDAPLRRRLSDFSQIRRSTREGPLDHRNAIQQTQNRQFLDPNEPFGGRRGSFRSQNEPALESQTVHPHQPHVNRLQQQLQQNQIQHHLQQQNYNRMPTVQLPHQHHYQTNPSNDTFGQTFSDHFDQYRTLVSKYSNIQRQQPLDHLEECLNRRTGATASINTVSTTPNVLSRSPIGSQFGSEDTFDESTQPKHWRTASLYRPTAAQNHNQSLGGGGGGGVGGVGTSTGLKRKPSLQPNVVKQVNKPVMSREEVSVLSHNRREQQRIELEMKEKLSRNPFLYLMNPQFTNWLSRQQLVMLVLVINISLALLFFKLLI